MPADNAVNEQIIVDTSADDSETALKISNSKFYSNDIRNLSTRPFIRALNGKIIIEDSFFDNNTFVTSTSVSAIESVHEGSSDWRTISVYNSIFKNIGISDSGLFESGESSNPSTTGALYVENSQFLNIDKIIAQFLEAKNSIFSTGYNSNLNSMHRLSRGGTFTNCTIHGYQLGKWGSDGGTIKNSILVNGHII